MDISEKLTTDNKGNTRRRKT